MKRFIKHAAAAVVGSLCAFQIAVPNCGIYNEVSVNAAETSVRIDSSGRKMERLDRGVSAVSMGKSVYRNI